MGHYLGRYHRLFRSAGLALASLLIALMMLASCGEAASPTTSTTDRSGTPTATTSPGAGDSTIQPTPTATKGSGQPTPTPTKSSGTPKPTPTPTPTTGVIFIPLHVPYVHDVAVAQKLSSHSFTGLCPTGEVALSGGWSHSGLETLKVAGSRRAGTNGWTITIDDYSTAPLISMHIECLKNASGAVITERSSGTFTVPGNYHGEGTATCNAGEVLVGGGYGIGFFGSHTGMSVSTFMANGNTWQGYVSNSGASDQAEIVAECLSFKGISNSFILSPNQSNGATASCPSGTYVSGGGFFSSQIDSYAYLMAPASNGWKVAVNPTTSIKVYAMCVKFS